MTQQTTTSNKQLVDVRVECIHDKNVKVFNVNIKEGSFLVIDYTDRFGLEPDTEVFWSRYIDQVSNHTSEYKAATKAVENFLNKKSKS
jgi:hypothetical protein